MKNEETGPSKSVYQGVAHICVGMYRCCNEDFYKIVIDQCQPPQKWERVAASITTLEIYREAYKLQDALDLALANVVPRPS